MKLKGYAFIIIAAMLWGLIGPLGKLAFQEGISPLEVAFWRAMLAWGFFGVHAAITRQTRVQKKDLPAVFVFAVTGVTLFYGAYQLAVSKGGAALAAVLLYTAPAWVAVMSRLFFKEPMTPAKLTALALTLAGVTGVSLSGGSLNAIGENLSLFALLAGLLSGFCYALYYIFGKHFEGRYTSPNIFLYILPIGAAGLCPWITFAHKTGTAWLALILLAFLSTYAAYYIYYVGLRYLEATRAAVTATLEPVIAGIIAYFWWGEYFTFTGYVGSALILMSVVMMIWDGTRQGSGEKK
ncbi:MAG: EamA family transporter [Desulfobacteraceae bacterium 4572_88]|nr:MAG: EamA family transporter [Desulfobacteraceae bacterium 4572_88]